MVDHARLRDDPGTGYDVRPAERLRGRPMDGWLRGDPEVAERLRGRPMDGWLRVDPEVVDTDDDLRRWVARGIAYARSLGSSASGWRPSSPPWPAGRRP